LAPIDCDDRTTRRNELRQRCGIVPESATDLQDPASWASAEQVIALAFALDEEREGVSQSQTTGKHSEIQGAVDVLEPRSEIIGHVVPRFHLLFSCRLGARRASDAAYQTWGLAGGKPEEVRRNTFRHNAIRAAVGTLHSGSPRRVAA
jgi:hypothetical protein